MAESRTVQEELQERMLGVPIPRLVTRLAIPTITSMLIASVYNMADTFFVGKLNESATGAVGVNFTLMLFIQAVGFTLGMGSGANISRLMGAEDAEQAGCIATTGFLTSLLMGGMLSLLGIFFLDPFVRLMGATETIAPYAKDYARYLLIGAPYMAASFVLNNILRSQGNAFWSMIGLTAGGLVNIALDPLFIFALNMGVGGAALATIISQLVSFAILLKMVVSHSAARIMPKKYRIRHLGKILSVGLPSFYRQGMMSAATILLNRAAGLHGDAAVAAMTIVSRIMGFSFSALIGFYQGFQPVCGYNYGAKRYDRVRGAILFCLKVSTIFLLALAAGLCAFAPWLVERFTSQNEGARVIEIGSVALRLQAALLPSMSWAVMVNMAHQSLGMASKASLLSISRQGLFFIPLILFLPPALGLTGVQLAQPLADLLAFLLSIPFGAVLLRDLKGRRIRHAP